MAMLEALGAEVTIAPDAAPIGFVRAVPEGDAAVLRHVP